MSLLPAMMCIVQQLLAAVHTFRRNLSHVQNASEWEGQTQQHIHMYYLTSEFHACAIC